MSQTFFRAFRKFPEGHKWAPGVFVTDLRISIDRIFRGGYSNLAADIQGLIRAGRTREDAEAQYEVVEFQLVEVARYTVAEARKLRGVR
jgi:hypothetical protein